MYIFFIIRMFICCKTNKYFKNTGQPAEKFVENFGRKWKKVENYSYFCTR